MGESSAPTGAVEAIGVVPEADQLLRVGQLSFCYAQCLRGTLRMRPAVQVRIWLWFWKGFARHPLDPRGMASSNALTQGEISSFHFFVMQHS